MTTPVAKFLKHRKISVVGCPFSGGQPKEGVDEGPLRIIEAGLLDDIKALGWDVDFEEHHKFAPLDEKDDPPIGVMKRPRLV